MSLVVAKTIPFFFQVSYEDVDRLKELAVTENMRVPHFLHDHSRYMEHLERIMEVNELTDAELKEVSCREVSFSPCLK